MKKNFGEYVRIARGFFGCSSFWRGNGHFLYVKGNGFLLPFSEEYFRFEFLKVQSVVATKTARGTVTSILSGAGAIVAALLVVASISGLDGSPSDPVLYVMAVLLILFAMGFLAVIAVNIVMGPTCVVRIQTAVRAETIRPLLRWRLAKEVLVSMQTEIELAQVSALGKTPEPEQPMARPSVPETSVELPPIPSSLPEES
ncbi:MAG: hypothetical protein O3C21_07705 [Verrucomicrobia bacterium]|nr:hypothetical protein [Verrucomicrobiota bacterium]